MWVDKITMQNKDAMIAKQNYLIERLNTIVETLKQSALLKDSTIENQRSTIELYKARVQR